MKRLTFSLLILVFINLFNPVKPHAAPDLNDFVQELIRGQLVAQGPGLFREWAKSALTRPLVNIFKDLGDKFTEDNIPTEGPQISSNPTGFDEDADPQFSSPALSATCVKQMDGLSSILYPWQMFANNGQDKNNALNSKKKVCIPVSTCGSRISFDVYDKSIFCGQSENSAFGVCCPQDDQTSMSPPEIKLIYINNASSHNIKPVSSRFQSILTEGTTEAMQKMKGIYLKQEEWKRNGNIRPLQTLLDPVLPEARDIADGGLGLVDVTIYVASKVIGSTDLLKQVHPASVLNTQTARIFCPASLPPKCDPRDALLYRTIDGSCNNFQDQSISQVFQPLIRMTSSAYDDGVFSPRILSREGKNSLLPSSRKISTALNQPQQISPSTVFTFGFAIHLELVGNDLSQTVNYDLGSEDSQILCCSNDGKYLKDEQDVHPLCFNIDVPTDDPLGIQCESYMRSMVSSKPCNLGPGQQLNQATHWLDLSPVYGSLDRVSNSLREFKGGRLRVFEYREEDYLLLHPSCNLATLEGTCAFLAGDQRVNQNLYLTMLQTVWRREHNRVAFILSTMNPRWSDDMIFQEARRLVIAEYQHITFNEVLPSVIGSKFTRRFNLGTNLASYTDYRPEIDGSVSNELATAAFRIGHSTIPDFLKLISDQKNVSQIPYKDAVNAPLRLIGDGIPDSVLRGMTRISMGKIDQFFSQEVTGKLMDLFSYDIQEGRDHGLPSYSSVVNALSSYCDLPSVFSFKDFTALMSATKVSQLQNIYERFDDVDLYVGGLMEEHVTGGIVGPTFACIIGDQFSRSKFGDRFHYQHGGLANSFTTEQLQQIRLASAARIYCDVSRNVHKMQPLAFQKISSINPLIDCSNYDAIPRLDLSSWTSVANQ